MSSCCGKKRPAVVWWALGAIAVGVLALALAADASKANRRAPSRPARIGGGR